VLARVGKDQQLVLLDVKESRPSAALHARGSQKQPPWDSYAQRVTAVQRMVQACPIAYLQPVDFAGRSWTIRALQPSIDRLDMNAMRGDTESLRMFVVQMGRVTAWGALRAASWRDSASIDQLLKYGRRNPDAANLLHLAKKIAHRTEEQWRVFKCAYDAGEL